MKENKTIYKLLGDYKKEDVDKVIKGLSDKDKKLIDKRYKSFKKEDIWTDEDRVYFYRLLIPRIRRILDKMAKRPKLIYEYFQGYKKDDVNEAIKHLKQEYQDILYLRYGIDLENPSALSDKWKNEHIKLFHNHILIDIQKYLDYKTTSRKVKTIYELLNEYSKEEINAAIMRLEHSDKELLRKRYGDNLEFPSPQAEWNASLNKSFYRHLLSKIRLIIKQNRKNIYKYFPDFEPYQVDEAIKLLDDKTKAQLIVAFNYSKINTVAINNVKTSINIEKQIIAKISSRLKRLYVGHKIKTIYDYFPDNTKEEVDEAILLLSKKDRELLYFKYNNNLEKPVKNLEWNSKYSGQFFEITKKLKRILSGRTHVHSTTIYDYFSNVSEEIVNGLLINLFYDDKKLIYLRYGADLHNPQKSELWNKSWSSKFEALIKRLETKIKNAETYEEVLIFEDDLEYQEIIKEYIARKYDKKEFILEYNNMNFGLDVQQRLVDILDDFEYQVVSLRYIENFTIEDISYILIIEKQEVIKILKKAMYLYKLERLKDIENKRENEDLKRIRKAKDNKIEE